MNYLFFLFSCLTLVGCANIQNPSGGPKDEVPPELIKAIPENETTYFNSNSIILFFDEFIQLQNPGQQIIISPPLETPPEITAKKKSIIIEFEEKLKSNTTYTINFGESIKDINESNTLFNYVYVFSTGSTIDSFTIEGSVNTAASLAPGSEMLIILYKDLSDSVVFNQKPYYFTRTDDKGNFRLNYLSGGEYKIIALKDNNLNYKYDPVTEAIAYFDSNIVISNQPINNLQLFSFNETPAELKIATTNQLPEGRIDIVINKSIIDTPQIKPIPNYSVINQSKDTITTWYEQIPDSISLHLPNDTLITIIPFSRQPDSLMLIYLSYNILPIDSAIPASQNLKIRSEAPIDTFDLAKFKIVQDSTNLNLSAYNISYSNNKLDLIFNVDWQQSSTYIITIENNALRDIYGRYSSSAKKKFKILPPMEASTFVLNTNLPDTMDYIIQIYQQQDRTSPEVVKEIIHPKSKGQINLKNFPPGTYSVSLIMDQNRNKRWDTGIYPIIQPEKVIKFEQAIQLKPGWEATIDLEL